MKPPTLVDPIRKIARIGNYESEARKAISTPGSFEGESPNHESKNATMLLYSHAHVSAGAL